MSAALLRVDIGAMLEQDDVSKLGFLAQRVSCAGEAFEPATVASQAPIAELLLSVTEPTIAGEALAPGAQHAFADQLVPLEPGCYDISLTPLSENGAPSRNCSPATATAVRVEPELTTETVLVSQCRSSEVGLSDTVLALNHSPMLGPLTYGDTRFVATCAPTSICVTAQDVDQDPLELVWEVEGGSDQRVVGPVVISSVAGPGSRQECVSITPRANAVFDFRVTAYDRASLSGTPVRIESLLASVGFELSSHAALSFSLLATGEAPCASQP